MSIKPFNKFVFTVFIASILENVLVYTVPGTTLTYNKTINTIKGHFIGLFFKKLKKINEIKNIKAKLYLVLSKPTIK